MVREISAQSGPAAVLKVPIRLQCTEQSGFERDEQLREVVSRVVDLGAHGIANEIVLRVGDDLMDGLPRCVRVHLGIEVVRFKDDRHAVMDMNDGRRCRLGE